MDSRATGSLPPPQSPYLPFLPPPAPSGPAGFNLNDRVSPSMFILLLILAVIFFISGVLHLLVRFLLRPPRRDPDRNDDVSAFQGQLQQLFHLHDAGVDQSFIDALPVFNYKAIIGVKDPFDCAVCLCEFEPDDKLRLLPKCSHAFHVDCIDTWLLSHSTCPLCRTSLLVDLPSLAGCSPVVLVLDSGGESSQEIISDYNNINNNNNNSIIINNSIARVSSHSSEEFTGGKSMEIQSKGEENPKPADKVVSIKLGKYRNINGGGSNIGADGDDTPGPRRCFSMGSFAYVMDESSSLWVPIRTPATRQSGKKTPMPLIPGHHQPALSECGCGPCGSWREFNNFEAFRFLEIRDTEENGLVTKNESFSVSKIWTRAGRRESSEGSRRSFSFRFPINRALDSEEMKGKGRERRALSEIDMGRWGGTSEDGDMRSRSSLDSNGHEPSFARRTLLWIMGRPSKVVGSSASSDV